MRRLEPGDKGLTEIRAALLWRAEALGSKLSTDPDLHLIVDGKIIRPEVAEAGLCRFVVPAGTIDVLLVSRATISAEIDPGSHDIRPLGVSIERVQFTNSIWRSTSRTPIPRSATAFRQGDAPDG